MDFVVVVWCDGDGSRHVSGGWVADWRGYDDGELCSGAAGGSSGSDGDAAKSIGELACKDRTVGLLADLWNDVQDWGNERRSKGRPGGRRYGCISTHYRSAATRKP